ncbi:unnamed protein product [Rhizoctonia solani]|uniref:Fungal-type protein kinase domain-containing protein n=1 Tax=Rhizoctonia solani TaxID=456999 RepID=A0A8H3DYJ4_9AGAM|nr:unnamed protein product [Rhizoctonia solani]
MHMQTNSSCSTDNIASSGYAISGGSTTNQPDFAPHVVADLRRSEHCLVENLLEALLRRCVVPSPPDPEAAPSHGPCTPRMPSTGGSALPNATSSTDSTGRAEGPPNPNNQGNTSESPTPLLQRCLEAVHPKCDELAPLLAKLKISGKDTKRYTPLVEFLNCALFLLKEAEPSGICPASDLDVIFAVNYPRRIHWRPGSDCSPDIVLLSCSGARRCYDMSDGEWTKVSEACLAGGLMGAVGGLEWPDVLAPAEVEWNNDPISAQVPIKYETTLTSDVSQLPTNNNNSDPSEAPSRDTAHNSVSEAASSSTRLSKSIPSTDSSTRPNLGNDAVNSEVPGTGATALLPAKRTRAHLESNDSGSATKKQRNHERNHSQPTVRDDVVNHTGCNAAEMLHCSAGRRHALSLVIIDENIWVWWCDRQGAIQTTGINFFQDLPHLLVLLLAFQRFTLADWGFDIALDPSIPPRHYNPIDPTSNGSANNDSRGKGVASDGASHGKNPAAGNPTHASKQPGSQVPVTAKFKVNPSLTIHYNSPVLNPLHAPFCLKGRSTTSFDVTNASEAATPEGSHSKLVAKLYWPHHDRSKEEDIIQDARNVASDLDNHLPRVIGSCDIDPVGTFAIRQELGINASSPCPPRVLRLIVFERLMPITDLQGDDFLIALVECMKCHFVLWNSTKQIRHLDISLSNLMVRDKDGRNYGVLNDWDLSSEGKNEPGRCLTTTIPFTALTLLHMMKRVDIEVDRLYYFEVESFFWVMIWVFLAYSDKDLQLVNETRDWRTGDPGASQSTRLSFLVYHLYHYGIHVEWKPYSAIYTETIAWIKRRFEEPNENETTEHNLGLLREYLAILGKKLGDKIQTGPIVAGL